jgi:hypothetical protein
MLTFYRKTVFYQEKHQRTVTRKMVISPMVEPNAVETADAYQVEGYSVPSMCPPLERVAIVDGTDAKCYGTGFKSDQA